MGDKMAWGKVTGVDFYSVKENEYVYKKKYNCTCKECGNKFTSNMPHAVTCSKKCKKDRKNRKCKEFVSKKWYRDHPEIEKTCFSCGEKFTTRQIKTVCCSEQCKKERKALIQKLTRSKNPEDRIKYYDAIKYTGVGNV